MVSYYLIIVFFFTLKAASSYNPFDSQTPYLWANLFLIEGFSALEATQKYVFLNCHKNKEHVI